MNDEEVEEDSEGQSLARAPVCSSSWDAPHILRERNHPSQTVEYRCGYAKHLQLRATSADSHTTLFPEGKEKGAHVTLKAPLMNARRAAPDPLSPGVGVAPDDVQRHLTEV